jgi:hypothetical protein
MLPILIVQAVLAGAATLGLLSWVLGASSTISMLFTVVLLIAIVLHVALVLVEVFGSHTNRHVAIAARYMSRGGLRNIFWGLFFVVGSVLPVVILVIALVVPVVQVVLPVLLGIAGILALVGLFAYEHCFVVAGQIVPLS